MDGSYNEAGKPVACVLAEAERSPCGLTHTVFESLVRSVWGMNVVTKDAEALQSALEERLAPLGGLEISVKASRLLAGALDVTGKFCYAGKPVTHTVHLW